MGGCQQIFSLSFFSENGKQRSIVMISGELHKIIDTISAHGEMNFLEPTTEDNIVAFEKKHDIRLPTKYKEWLLYSDGGEIFLPAGIQFYGVEHKPVIDVEDDRLDDSYIVIGALTSGDPVVFKKEEERISIYNLEDDRIEDDETYEDFYAFLNDTYNMLGIGD